MLIQSLVPTTMLNGSRKGVYNVLVTCVRGKKVRWLAILLPTVVNHLDITSHVKSDVSQSVIPPHELKVLT